MDNITFMISVLCVCDDWLKGRKLRRRGPRPILGDSEVLTMEIVGEFLGLDTDSGIFNYFRTHYADWFPGVSHVHRTTFVRQAANLWAVKQQIWQALIDWIEHDPMISIVDSFPVPVCRFARAHRCRRLAGYTAFGKDDVARQTFLGLRAHLRVGWPGVIVDFRLAPANVHELQVAEELFEGVGGWVLGDRNYWKPELAEKGRLQGLYWLTPYRWASREPAPWPTWLKHKRYRIDTIFSQLVERFHAKRVWARDAWHFWSRWLRKILSHTLAVFLCMQTGLPPLSFADLITN
jgi:hypothetical protein